MPTRPPDDDLTVGPAASTAVAARTPYVPGVVIAKRYRLVALLGRGGMGEVYRADDLTLDQPVALKFLPAGVASDAAQLAQFHNELRTARHVSHKNVCRLYDLGEADGRPFLTMEYVDGEDLAALLRRIGRVPEERAIAIARQLCAGVAAAHDRGVIHRDLKPSNVMIDGNGDVRITDFGIATAAKDAGAPTAGTPQYMAPEQLAGGSASIRTDIYALGLILFELFTGRRAFDAKTIADLRSLHDTGTVTSPSSIVRDLDPAVERIVMRCLSRDPQQRPGSALAVSAALPGGDALADALSAGETPSPELLAAAAEIDAVPVRTAVALFAVLVVSMTIYVGLSPFGTLAALAPLDKPPAVLADRAQQIINDFGYTDVPGDSVGKFSNGPDFQRWLIDTDATIDRWNRARVALGPALLYWYRTSPRDLDPLRRANGVTPTDPPMTVTGMSLVMLDSRARLWEFHRVPPQRDPGSSDRGTLSWDPAFRAAGLDRASFTPAAPEWTPPDFADTRQAWEGSLPENPGIPLRVEGAAYAGRIVSFYVLGPWARATRMQPLANSAFASALRTFSSALWLSLLLASALGARYNLSTGRADRRSAARLAAVYLAVQVAAWSIGAHHLSSFIEEAQSFFGILALIVFQAAMLWTLYLALEPYGRRFWPDGLLGWTRLFSGRLRDPRIGREILIGSALGGLLMLADLGRAFAPRLIGLPPGTPSLGTESNALGSIGSLVLTWTSQLFNSLQSGLIIALLFVVLRLVTRRTWSAVVLGMVITTFASGSGSAPVGGVAWLELAGQALAIAILTVGIFRYGLLVTIVTLLVDNIPGAIPIVTHGPSWAAVPGHLSLAIPIALAAFGFYAARAGQPLFGRLDS